MKRRSFLAALAALPVVGKMVTNPIPPEPQVFTTMKVGGLYASGEAFDMSHNQIYRYECMPTGGYGWVPISKD